MVEHSPKILSSEEKATTTKATGWDADGRRFKSASALLFVCKNCGLWTLSSGFALTINQTRKWLTQLPTLMQSFWW